MEYSKVGRGGAGNFYSQLDVETVSRRATEDLEAQANGTTVAAEDLQRSRAEYAHSGRGGAGNYTNASKLTTATAENTGVTPSLQESKPPEVGYYGRGGVGNYKSGDAEKKREERRASEVQEKIHQQTVNDVEMALQEPKKAHLAKERLDYES